MKIEELSKARDLEWRLKKLTRLKNAVIEDKQVRTYISLKTTSDICTVDKEYFEVDRTWVLRNINNQIKTIIVKLQEIGVEIET